MRLSDIMSAMHLGTYAEVALLLFMLTFVAIGINVFRRRNAGVWERARHLPLEPELPSDRGGGSRDVVPLAPALTTRIDP